MINAIIITIVIMFHDISLQEVHVWQSQAEVLLDIHVIDNLTVIPYFMSSALYILLALAREGNVHKQWWHTMHFLHSLCYISTWMRVNDKEGNNWQKHYPSSGKRAATRL